MSDKITHFYNLEPGHFHTLVTPTDRTPCPCSSCGKDMRDPETGAVLSGLTVDNTQATSEFLRRQLGRFAGKSYSFCWECWLEASMPPVPHAAGLAGEECPRCKGRGGWVAEDQSGTSYSFDVVCPVCRGTGRLAGEGGR